jgi:hypothetical protein
MKHIDYIKYIDTVLKAYPSSKIVYIPHRQEVMSDILEYHLYQHKNVEILVPDVPIELYFLENGIEPTNVISFMTTALFVIKKMFPTSNPRYIEIDTSPYTEFHQKNIQLIYDNYKKEGIEKFESHHQKV